MPFTSTPITVKDGAAADKSLIAYNDGTSSAFAHPLLDTDGAIISPATSGKQDTGNASLSGINGKLPSALSDDMMKVKPLMGSSGHISVQTAATGSNWTAFNSQACTQLTISNCGETAAAIEVRQGGSGVGLPIAANGIMPFYGLTNANQLEVRRLDLSNSQKTIAARWEA